MVEAAFFLRRALVASPALVLLIAISPASAAPDRFDTLSGIELSVDASGSFSVRSREPVWTFGGTVDAPVTRIALSTGRDGVGTYHKIAFNYSTSNGVPVSASIRAYYQRSIVIFSSTLLAAANNGPLFPTISTYPQGMYKFAFQFTYQYVYGPWGAGPGQLVAANSSFTDSVNTTGSYYIVAPVGDSGIAPSLSISVSGGVDL